MKKFVLLAAFVGTVTAAFTQTLFTYGPASVDKTEFLKAYNKNKIPEADKEKALREYLDLYIKFKLKVKAAMDLRLDTLPQLQYDAQSFRSQIEDSYLNNEDAVNNLLSEAFTRSQHDLHVLHFFVPVNQAMPAVDTLKAFKSIFNVYTALSSGKSDYAAIAGNEAVPVKFNNLGFITVFSIPYEYENLVYGVKPGETTKPYRSKNGWHVFKVAEQRKAVGRWKVAQILFSIPPDASTEEKNNIKKKADSVHQLILKGEDFGKMARWFSDDKVTYGNNGEMAEFGSGKFDSRFENEVFKLTIDNQVSRPFLTDYGYHIVKRLSQIPVPADRNDPAFQFDLKQKIQDDPRINIARELFTKEVFKQVKLKKSKNVTDADLYRFADSVVFKPTSETANSRIYPIANKAIYVFDNNNVLTGKDWLDFVRSYKGTGELYQGESNESLLDKFVTSTVMEYYRKNLEQYNADFRYQMEEFRNGNVLFEIMERNIWGKASTDADGLQKLYTQNKNKYVWGASANLVMFNCATKEIAEAARAALKNGKYWKAVAEEFSNDIQADSGRFELAQMAERISAGMKTGELTDIVVNPADGNASFTKLINYNAANLPRSFDEAKGLVINDYQNMLEEKWIAELKKKYPVKVNDAVFQSLLK